MTVLSIAQAVADEIGVTRPSSLVGNSDLTAKRLLASAKAEGQALYRCHKWSILHREHTFETTASVDNYALPDDWGRPIGDTAWDQTMFRRMYGNRTPAQWQAWKSGLAASAGITRRYRVLAGPLAGSILIDPVPSATGDDLVIEYVSKFWCEDSEGTGQADIAADTDDIRLDHELFRLGLLWRARKTLGLDYADDRLDYERAVAKAKVADFNLPTIHSAPPYRSDRLLNIPNTGFGGE